MDVLKILIIFSIDACSLSQPSRYARRYARALRANLRDVDSGSVARDIESRINPWNCLYLFLRRKFCFILPQSYSMPWPASSQWPLGDITRMCPRDSTSDCKAPFSVRKSSQLPST